MDIMNMLTANIPFFVICCGILGLLVGSFLNVVIYRLPKMLKQEWEQECNEYLKVKSPLKYKIFNLLHPRSHCPHCQEPIKSLQNIPLLSYVLLRGKCHHCRVDIPQRYPLVELLSLITSVVVAWHFGITIQTIAALFFTWALIALIFIDLDHQILPDNITLPLLWLGLMGNAFNLFTSPADAIIGAASAYLFLWLVAFVFKKIRKIQGMGHGDFKLFAVIGAWFGWQTLPIIILIASLIGAIVGITLIAMKKHEIQKPLPFGPYLAIAGWIGLLWGTNILHWYLQFTYMAIH
jgi:leader peptidase (prepilin peptidase) / N-methyltransferase